MQYFNNYSSSILVLLLISIIFQNTNNKVMIKKYSGRGGLESTKAMFRFPSEYDPGFILSLLFTER